MESRALSAIVVATDDAPRMRSERPKPIHMLCGKPMLVYVVDALVELPVDRAVIVVGHGAERVTKTLQADGPDLLAEFVEQPSPAGAADAVAVALTAFVDDLDEDRDLIVVPADLPLLRAGTIRMLVGRHRATGAVCTILTTGARTGPMPLVVRGREDRIQRLTASVDAAPADAAPADVEYATGVFCVRRSALGPALRRIAPDERGEIPLSGVVEVLHDAGYEIEAIAAIDEREVASVDDRVQLADAEAELRRRINEEWMHRGVNLVDPAATYIDSTVRLAPDVTLFPGTILQGATVIGARAEIGPGTRLVDCAVGADAVVGQTVANDAEIGAGARVGPFAVLEPGTRIGEGVRTGPFYTAAAES